MSPRAKRPRGRRSSRRVFWKYIASDGLAVHGSELRWAPERSPARPGAIVRHPSSKTLGLDAAQYLCASDNPHTWSWYGTRLLEVEPVGAVVLNSTDGGADEYGALAWRIVREVDPFTVLLGPQGPNIRALVERVGQIITDEQCDELDAARVAGEKDTRLAVAMAHDAKRDPSALLANDSIRGVANRGTWYEGLACAATRDALWALVVRDRIGSADSVSGEVFTQGTYDRLTRPVRDLLGQLHPSDAIPTAGGSVHDEPPNYVATADDHAEKHE